MSLKRGAGFLKPRGDAKISEFDLESPIDANDTMYEFVTNLTDDDTTGTVAAQKSQKKPVNTMSVAEQQLWYAKYTFWTVFTIGSLLILGTIALIVLGAVILSSNQAQRAVTVIDRVYEMRDYTKTMTDLTVGSQESFAKAVKDFQVSDMIRGIHSVINKGESLMNNVQPTMLQEATTMGTQLLDVLQRIDVDEGRRLMQNLNNWSSAIDPATLQQQLVDPMHTFLASSNNMLQKVHDQNILQRVGEVASATVDLESRLQRLNQITISIPERK